MNKNELQHRSKDFAHRCVKLCMVLPKTILGKHIQGQLIRSSTSVAANYRAACIAQTKAGFISKLSIVIEEVKESDYVIILDSPEVPLERSKPNKKLMAILAGILGIGLGMVLAFVREFAANSEKEEKDKMTEAKSLVRQHLSDFIPGKSK